MVSLRIPHKCALKTDVNVGFLLVFQRQFSSVAHCIRDKNDFLLNRNGVIVIFLLDGTQYSLH